MKRASVVESRFRCLVFFVGMLGLGLCAHAADRRNIATEEFKLPAVDFILQRRRVSKIDLMGWSWRTTIMGLYTTLNNDKVNRLVLYAPSWISTTPSLIKSEAADERSVQALRADWRRYSLDHDGEESHAVIPGSSAVSRRIVYTGAVTARVRDFRSLLGWSDREAIYAPVSEAHDLPASNLPL